MSVPENSKYDVVIVGGGMVGTSLACVLQQYIDELDFKVLIIESVPLNFSGKSYQPSFDARSTVLSHGTAEYFQVLGIWDSLSVHATAIRKIHVSDQGRFGAVRMDSVEQGIEALGYVIENALLGKELNRALLQASKVEIWDSASVVDISPDIDEVSVVVKKENTSREIKARLLVLAEGGRSGLCEQLGIHRVSTKYNQTAIIANVSFADDHCNIAYERFTSKGPLALLPLSQADGMNRSALVWTHPDDAVEGIMALSDEDFLQQLEQEFGTKLGKFTRVGERHSYPLSLIRAEEQIRPGIVLLGNVVHTLHPVAGQGFNLALRDAMCLAEHLVAALRRKENPGAVKTLQAYLMQRVLDQEKTVGFSHYMTRLFSSDNQALVWARKFGLISIDLLPVLKKTFSRQAMGEGGRMAKVRL